MRWSDPYAGGGANNNWRRLRCVKVLESWDLSVSVLQAWLTHNRTVSASSISIIEEMTSWCEEQAGVALCSANLDGRWIFESNASNYSSGKRRGSFVFWFKDADLATMFKLRFAECL